MKTRLATFDDMDAVSELLYGMYEECGFHSLSGSKVAAEICASIEQGRCHLLEDEGAIIGTIAIELYQPWWTEDWQAMDKWLYVAREHRSTGAFKALVKCAVHWASLYQVPLYIGLNSKGATRKRKLFSRYMKEALAAYQTNYVGGIFEPAQASEGI